MTAATGAANSRMPDVAKALTRMVDPLTSIRLGLRLLDEQSQADPATLARIRELSQRGADTIRPKRKRR